VNAAEVAAESQREPLGAPAPGPAATAGRAAPGRTADRLHARAVHLRSVRPAYETGPNRRQPRAVVAVAIKGLYWNLVDSPSHILLPVPRP
jgi:hypothetical protein